MYWKQSFKKKTSAFRNDFNTCMVILQRFEEQTNTRVYFNYRCKSALPLGPYFVEISFRINAGLDCYEICFILYPVSYFPSTHQVFSLSISSLVFFFNFFLLIKIFWVFLFIIIYFLTCFEWHSPVKKWKFV